MASPFTHTVDFNGSEVGFSYVVEGRELCIHSSLGDFRLAFDGEQPREDEVKVEVLIYLNRGGLTLSTVDSDLSAAPEDDTAPKPEPVFRSNPVILLVEGESREHSLQSKLHEEQFDVVPVSDMFDAITQFNNINCDAVLSDVRLPRGDGIMLLKYVRASERNVPYFLMTQHEDVHEFSAHSLGATGFFQKPFSIEILLDTLRKEIGQASYYTNREKEFFT